MTGRLSEKNLPALPSSVALPAYDRGSIAPGIVHLGVGAFHRAHQAAYVDDCLAAGEKAWGILGASLLCIEGDEIVHSILDVMAADASYKVIERAVHVHPTVSELIPTLLGQLEPLKDEPAPR